MVLHPLEAIDDVDNRGIMTAVRCALDFFVKLTRPAVLSSRFRREVGIFSG